MRKIRLFLFILIATIAGFLVFAYFKFPLPGDIPILMYHFIGTDEDASQSKNYVSRQSFSDHIKFLKNHGFNVISMDQYYDILEGKLEPEGKQIVITFDDGNYSFHDDAFPILSKHQIPATIFLISDNLKKGLHGSMDKASVERLLQSGLVTIGGHTKTHPYLSQLATEKVQEEIVEDKKELEKIFGVPVNYLAYPYGDFDSRSSEIAREAGYRLAFTTSHKKLKDLSAGRYAITRIKITRTADHLAIFWFKSAGLYHFFKDIRHQIKKLF